MKKISVCILVSLCFAVLGGWAAGGVESSASASDSPTYIGEDAAKAAALEHAGLAESEVTYVEVKLDYDDGRTVYDIEFYFGNAEYDYEIDAYTGDIWSFDNDIEDYTIAAADSTQSTVAQDSSTSSPSSDYVGEDAAKAAALEHAGLTESEVTYVKVKLDREDGTIVYEIEFYFGNAEYDYEVDAYSGNILSYDYDVDNYTISSVWSNDSTHISLDEAKSIALTRANLTTEQVTYTEASFEYDDGMAVYQIDFIFGGMEYEVEINAVDGTIVEYDVESQYD